MNQFSLVFKHYFMRTLKDKLGLLTQIVTPFIIISIFTMINEQWSIRSGFSVMFNGYNFGATATTIPNLFFFQLFGGMWILNYLYEDLKEVRRFRLFATPNDRKIFPIAAMLGSWLVSILQGFIIIVGTSILFDVYWGNKFFLLMALLAISLFSQFLFVLIFALTNSLTVANGIGFPLIFIIGSFGDVPIAIRDLINHRIIAFMSDWSPVMLARRAVTESGSIATINLREGVYIAGDITIAMRNLIALFAMSAIIAAIAYCVGKVRKIW